ncbi:hypothetical protein [Synechococcus sp. UW179A]|uniref:hypothetical protein n=1 Tax=Synechococcus sp. UW179A TaxID=2575510 RepID=UPI001481EDB6|nr:hypothetical protein [Synechococcus sp. UW179A]
MTDSETWWKADTQPRAEVTSPRSPASVSFAAWLLTFALVGLSGCGEAENAQSSSDAISPDAPVAELSPPQPSTAATGLIPLPTREQVLSSVPEGREDPFSPIVGESSQAIAPDTATGPDFKVKGVVAVGAELRALVSVSELSGTVCVGPRGRCPGDAVALLPKGWTVNSIDLDRGCLSLSISKESQRLCIA